MSITQEDTLYICMLMCSKIILIYQVSEPHNQCGSLFISLTVLVC